MHAKNSTCSGPCAMPASDPPPYRIPSPDLGHESIRGPLAKAIDDLADTALGVEDAYYLTSLLLDVADSLATQLDAHRIRIDAANVRCDTAADGIDDLQAKVTALTARVDALHATQPTLMTGPDAAG